MLIKKLIIREDEGGNFHGHRPEVVEKVIKEVLNLFRLPLYDEAAEKAKQWALYTSRAPLPEPVGEVWEVCHTITAEEPDNPDTRITVTTTFIRDGRESQPVTGESSADEAAKAAVHRLVKLNFYNILINDSIAKDLNIEEAPWGILHGVRPTKIVHHALDRGSSREAVIDMLRRDYGAGTEKSEMITDLAIRQRPFLAQTDEKTVSIYVGIPFCLTRCLYCSFPAYILPGREGLQRFWQAMTADIKAAREAVEKYGFKVQNVYIGGGTPTALPNDMFEQLLQAVETNFITDDTIEFTVEAGRPDSMSLEKIGSMSRHGVNRVSVNPQTMQLKTLRRIGRRHTPRDIAAMYHLLRGLGDFSINMDLIIGLPGETTAEVADTMAQLEPLKPDDITVHALSLKRGSRLAMHIGDYELPDDEEAQKMFAVARDKIESWGLHPYYLYRQGYQRGELENVGFCRPGAESMYNIQIMEERQTIIGIGGAATTKVVDPATGVMRACFNAKELSVYLDRIDGYIQRRADFLAAAYDIKTQE